MRKSASADSRYKEGFMAYVSPDSPLYSKDEISLDELYGQPIWIIREGLRKQVFSDVNGEVTYERFFEGGRVGMLIQIVNENGGVTIIPETHRDLILFSQQAGLRPIVNPKRSRTISLLVRNDYIHEALLNAVVDSIKNVIPSTLWDSVIRGQHLKL